MPNDPDPFTADPLYIPDRRSCATWHPNARGSSKTPSKPDLRRSPRSEPRGRADDRRYARSSIEPDHRRTASSRRPLTGPVHPARSRIAQGGFRFSDKANGRNPFRSRPSILKAPSMPIPRKPPRRESEGDDDRRCARSSRCGRKTPAARSRSCARSPYSPCIRRR